MSSFCRAYCQDSGKGKVSVVHVRFPYENTWYRLAAHRLPRRLKINPRIKKYLSAPHKMCKRGLKCTPVNRRHDIVNSSRHTKVEAVISRIQIWARSVLLVANSLICSCSIESTTGFKHRADFLYSWILWNLLRRNWLGVSGPYNNKRDNGCTGSKWKHSACISHAQSSVSFHHWSSNWKWVFAAALSTKAVGLGLPANHSHAECGWICCLPTLSIHIRVFVLRVSRNRIPCGTVCK